MSLFKIQEYWSVNLNVPDAFDGNCLLIETINSRSCIFLGSHDGYLRAFCPNDENPGNYRPSDLLYETLFPVPVLQMIMGKFASGSSTRQLAILHPKLLSVYSVHQSETEGEYPLSLRHIYQHILQHTSYGLASGPFGHIEGRDFLCVQSLDGQLSFFEQETATFSVQLPDYLLPSPFRYIATTDSFIFQDCQNYLKCFTYEALSQTSRKTLKPLWTHNIGDMILDIHVWSAATDASLLVLTEKNLIDLNEHGKIEWMKQFEFQPVCFSSFVNKSTNELIELVCSEDMLYVYEKTCLKWCAKIDFRPVCLQVLNLTVNPGLIVTLSDSGLLQCVYLGTMPSLYLIPPTAEPDINVLEAERELKALQSKITDTELGTDTGAIVKLSLTLDRKVENRICRGVVDLTALIPVNNVQVVIDVEPPFVASIKSLIVASIVNNEQISFQVSVDGQTVASSLAIRVFVSYFLANGAARATEALNQLPFELAADSAIATKDAPVKITLTTNKPTCPLNDLFPDYEASANAVGFSMAGLPVTIAAAKTSQRYRIQGNNYEDFTLVLVTLISRLNHFYRKIPDFSLNFSGSLPITAYFELIQKYYELITRRRLQQDQLAQRTTQYRIIQKKVLAALNDLTPKPTSALYKVLDDTYNMIRSVLTDLESLELELMSSRSRLASMARLITTLVGLTPVNKSDFEHFRMAFSPLVYDAEEQGWLEAQNATLSLLLRTKFAKSSKDQNKPLDLTLEPLSDVSKLCKLFSTIIDRATKGSSLVERSEFEKENLPTVPSVKEWQQRDLNILPEASKFTDFNSTVPEKFPKVTEPVKEDEENQSMVLIETEATIETHYPRENNEDQKTNNLESDEIWDLNVDEIKI